MLVRVSYYSYTTDQAEKRSVSTPLFNPYFPLYSPIPFPLHLTSHLSLLSFFSPLNPTLPHNPSHNHAPFFDLNTFPPSTLHCPSPIFSYHPVGIWGSGILLLLPLSRTYPNTLGLLNMHCSCQISIFFHKHLSDSYLTSRLIIIFLEHIASTVHTK